MIKPKNKNLKKVLKKLRKSVDRMEKWCYNNKRRQDTTTTKDEIEA